MSKTTTIICLLLLCVGSQLFGDPPFITNVRVSDDAGAVVTINQGESCFALHGNNIYAICNLAERSFVGMIPFARSTTGGLSWDPNIPWKDVTAPNQWHSDPVILTDESGGIHMLIQYSTAVIRHYLSIDSGQTWIDTSNVSDPSTGGTVDKPWAIMKNGAIYVSWQEFGGSARGIRFARSYDNGASFQWTTVDKRRWGITCPAMDDLGVLYLIHGWDTLFCRRSDDDGTSWSEEKYLSDVVYESGAGDRAPMNSLTAYGDGVLFLTWIDNRNGTWDIFGKRSIDGGITWDSTFVVNDSVSGGQCKGWATFDQYGGLHVHYYHTPLWPTTTQSMWSVRYQYSSDSGATFEPSIRETDTEFQAYYHTDTTFMGEYHILQTDSINIYSIWTDGRDGNMNLYFTRAPLQIGSQEREISGPPISVEVPTLVTKNAVLRLRACEPRNVNVAAYDVTGRHVLTLFNGRITQTLDIPLTKHSLPKGITFLRIASPPFVYTCKFIQFTP
jgi:hypothetical protein